MDRILTVKYLIPVILAGFMLGCFGGSQLDGKYVRTSGNSVIKSFEFKSDKVILDMFPMKMAGGYEVREDTVFINVTGQGEIPLTIVDENTLKSEGLMMNATYVKE